MRGQEGQMLRFATFVNAPLVFRQLTGLSPQAFADVLPAFQQAEANLQQQAEQQRTTLRRRRPGGGRKPSLAAPEDRLLFSLVYSNLYPLQAVQAFLFGMSQAQACAWIHRLTPALNQALGRTHHVPKRHAADLNQLLWWCQGLGFFIDGRARDSDPKRPHVPRASLSR
jgi:hypothetical protein